MSKPRESSPEGKGQLSIRLPEDLKEALESESRKQGRSRNWLIENCMSNFYTKRPKPVSWSIFDEPFTHSTSVSATNNLIASIKADARSSDRTVNQYVNWILRHYFPKGE